MASPFPGMDPYIEDPEIWSDFHGDLAAEIRAQLKAMSRKRPPLEQPVPAAPYYITLSRANNRPIVEVWPIRLADTLPLIPVPLLEPDADEVLDLSAAVSAIYERGAYARLIDYQQVPPPPALSAQDKAWPHARLQAAGLRQ